MRTAWRELLKQRPVEEGAEDEAVVKELQAVAPPVDPS
jgi:hypothetical protein